MPQPKEVAAQVRQAHTLVFTNHPPFTNNRHDTREPFVPTQLVIGFYVSQNMLRVAQPADSFTFYFSLDSRVLSLTISNSSFLSFALLSSRLLARSRVRLAGWSTRLKTLHTVWLSKPRPCSLRPAAKCLLLSTAHHRLPRHHSSSQQQPSCSPVRLLPSRSTSTTNVACNCETFGALQLRMESWCLCQLLCVTVNTCEPFLLYNCFV